MKINAGVQYVENGMTASLRAMHVQSDLIGIANQNVTGFDKIGYQRKEAVVSQFTDFLGVHGVSTSVDDKIGRLTLSENPMDFALAKKGYFQTYTQDGIKLTRDGRFKLDKDGRLLALDGSAVLSNTGGAIQLHVMPEKLKDVVVNDLGQISVFNKKTNKLEYVDTLGVVDAKGALQLDPDVKQGYNEHSNVSLEREFLGMMPVVRNFEANRQIYMIQSQNLSKTISQLGQAQ